MHPENKTEELFLRSRELATELMIRADSYGHRIRSIIQNGDDHISRFEEWDEECADAETNLRNAFANLIRIRGETKLYAYNVCKREGRLVEETETDDR